MTRPVVCLLAAIMAAAAPVARSADSAPRPVAHWPLQSDARDVVGPAHGEAVAVTFTGTAGGVFDGYQSRIRVPHMPALDPAAGDFSLAAWIRCQAPLVSAPGGIAGKFDPRRRRGFTLDVAASSPAYSGMSDARHLQFGIDDGRLGVWEDHGRPWPSSPLVSALVAYEGSLYGGISDAAEPQDRARVFRFAGGTKWIDCGRLGSDPEHHSVMSMLVHDGRLYAGTGIWDWVRALGGETGAPPPAPTRVFVYEGGTSWRDLGQVGSGARVLCLASFAGSLFAGLDSVGGGHVYRLDGATWVDCGAPDGRNLECLMPFAGALHAATHGNFYRWQGGTKWEPIGSAPHGINQVHALKVAGGALIAGTWPQGYVLRYRGGDVWDKIGRLGLPAVAGVEPCNEVMDLTVHNGLLYAGLIPKAEVYRHDADDAWALIGSLARRPDWDVRSMPTWARITCLTSFGGRLFAATGSCRGRAADAAADPSLGRVFSIQAGAVASHEHDIGGDWRHVVAVRRGDTLELHLDGRQVAATAAPAGPACDLSVEAPLWIGRGPRNSFAGAIADVRLYATALAPSAIGALAATRPGR